MRKKLIAAAVAGALGVPGIALAQASTVSVYGRIYMEYGYIDQGNGTNGPRNNVDLLQATGSNIGFRGEEKLGGGISAWFQCESTADFRGQSPQGFCSRNSAIGLKGSFGSLFMGRWDTPFKRTVLTPMSVGGSRITGAFGNAFLLTGGATSTLDGSNRGLWFRRQANTVNYDSPVFGGFQVMAQYSTTNGATASTTGAANAKPRIWSVGAQYRSGPLYISGAYERHNQFGGATGGDDKAWHIGAAYTFAGNVKVGAAYTQQQFQFTPAAESKVKAWTAGVEWAFAGPHAVLGRYTKADDVSGNATAPVVGASAVRPIPGPDTGAELWSIQYRYTFSKRTLAYFGYSRLDNDAKAQYALGGTFGTSAATLPAPGNSSDNWGIVIDHRF
jgi:predicted porin